VISALRVVSIQNIEGTTLARKTVRKLEPGTCDAKLALLGYFSDTTLSSGLAAEASLAVGLRPFR
jgi:hypothetical protein